MRTLEKTRFQKPIFSLLNSSGNREENEEAAYHKGNARPLVSDHFYSTTKQKLSYFNIPGEDPMLGMSVGDLIDFAATKYGDSEAFVAPFQNVRKTFRQIQQEVENLASGFFALGLKRGDRFAVWSPNTYESYLTQLAGWKAGLIVVCINAALQSRELLYALNKVGVRCIFISKVFRSQDYYEILSKSIPELKTCEPGNLKSSHAPDLEFVISVEEDLLGTIDFNNVLDMGTQQILTTIDASADVQFDNVCTLFFTSGTTGSPKAVMLSHHNLVNNGYFVGKRLQLQANDRILLPVPMFHVYACQIGIFAAMVHGATTILPSFGYDPKAIAEVASNERCTHITGTPTMFADVLKSVDDGIKLNLTFLKAAITGGATCPDTLVQDLRAKLPLTRIVSNYGMTEIGCTYMALADDPADLATTCGFPCENTEVKLVDRNGNIVPIGQEGELCVRSYGVTLGYWGEPERTLEVLEQSRWFHTGDLFTMQESGHGSMVGRIKEMVNRGGENVYPKEVEDFLKTHPKIVEAQVFGVPDQRMGEEPAVWIQMMDGQVMTPEDVKSYCKGQIAHFKIPKYVLFRDDFPKTPLGKIQKFRMREETLKFFNKE